MIGLLEPRNHLQIIHNEGEYDSYTSPQCTKDRQETKGQCSSGYCSNDYFINHKVENIKQAKTWSHEDETLEI